jgi:hypothetical protein
MICFIIQSDYRKSNINGIIQSKLAAPSPHTYLTLLSDSVYFDGLYTLDRAEDILAYKRETDTKRHEGLDALAAQEQELVLGRRGVQRIL